MSMFDKMAVMVVDGTSNVFGDTVSWNNGTTIYTGLGKYKDEKGDAKLGEVKYGIDHIHLEIKDSDFPGLKLLINLQKKPIITVNVRGVLTNFIGIVADAVSDGLCTNITLRVKP